MSVFEDIKAGLTEAVSIAKGDADPTTYRVHVPSDVDVAAIRRGLKMTQAAFASAFGFPTGTVRDWEQGRARPDTSARAYLLVIGRNPAAVREALAPEPIVKVRESIAGGSGPMKLSRAASMGRRADTGQHVTIQLAKKSGPAEPLRIAVGGRSGSVARKTAERG